MKFLIILCLLPLFASGQKIYKGKIVNAKTKQNIPFATVGLMKANVGINADESGEFILSTTTENIRDTLIISCVGYETLKIATTNVLEIIYLNEKQTDLSEVKVFSKINWTFTKLNNKDCCAEGFTTNGFQSQIAKLFKTSFDNSILTEVEIYKSNSLFVRHKSLFRLRFYDMDTITKAPSTELCNEVIEINTSNKCTKVNLEKYKIRVSNYFFVAIEWLKIEYNENIYTTRIEGKKLERKTYRPFILCNMNKQVTNVVMSEQNYAVWGLFYNNTWRPQPWISDLSISVTIKN